MKCTKVIAALALMFVVACSVKESYIEPNAENQVGEVVLQLSADARTSAIEVRALEETIPVDSFWVEILKEGSLRLYCKQYESAGSERILLNTGDYMLRAMYGDSLGVGFDRPFYMAEEPFIVHPQTVENISAVARMSNVRIKVSFSNNFAESFPDYYVIVRHNNPAVKHTLKYTKDETRYGYFPAGEVVIEVYADYSGTGNWHYYSIPATTFTPNDDLTLNLDVNLVEGSIVAGLQIDNSVEVIEKNLTIPERYLPQEAPEVHVRGANRDGYYYVVEASSETKNKMDFSCQANAGLASMVLTHDSQALIEAGIPAEIDFSSLTPELSNQLKGLGVKWSNNGRFGVVRLGNLLSLVGPSSVYEGKSVINSTYTLTVTDNVGKTSESKAYLKVFPNFEGNLIIQDYDIWATKLAAASIDVTRGNPDLVSVQYALAESELWNELSFLSKTGNKVVFDGTNGLKPDTQYKVRIMYDGIYEVGSRAEFVTETPAQVGNPSFEDYQIKDFTYSIFITGSKGNVIWYEPFSDPANAWWATNSSASLDASFSVANIGWKSYPTVTLQYGEAADGQISAMIGAVAVHDWGTSGTRGDAHNGEIFIGKADNGGEHRGHHVSDGHGFYSRPTALRLMHKFNPHNNGSYLVHIDIKDADGRVIGSGDVNDRKDGVGVWTELIVPVTYTITNAKAASIYISMRASANGDKTTRDYSDFNILGKGPASVKYEYGIHVGNLLWVDDVQLIY